MGVKIICSNEEIYTEVVREGIAENNISLRGRSNIRLEETA
jgi:hypothetical protein